MDCLKKLAMSLKTRFFLAEILCVSAIIFVAFYFRIYNSGLSFFSLDQARDFYVGLGIARGEYFPLLGPGQQLAFNLGPFFYYITALAFKFSHHLSAPYIQVGIFDTFSILLCYWFTRSCFGFGPALLAAVLYTVSIQAVFIGRYPGNVGYVHIGVMSFIWLYCRFLERGERKWLIASAFVLGISMQFHTSVFIFLPLFCMISIGRFRTAAWKPILFMLLIVALTHSPLIISEINNDFSNFGKFALLMNREIVGNVEGGYLSRLGGAFLINNVIGAMLLPRSISSWFQPFLSIQSVLYIFSVGTGTFFLLRKRWERRQSCVVVVLLAWVVMPLFIFPIYPRLNHNYLDVIYPGIMILAAVVVHCMKGRIKSFLYASLVLVIAANFIYLIMVDEIHTRKTGLIRLYRPSIVNVNDLGGGYRPIAEAVPASMQIAAGKRLIDVFGSDKNVINNLHGLGRLYLLDENKRFILEYLMKKRRRFPNDVEAHYSVVGLESEKYIQKTGDIHLAGPFFLRPCFPCDVSIDGDMFSSLNTWRTFDLNVYTLRLPRTIELKGRKKVVLYPPEGLDSPSLRYFVTASYSRGSQSSITAYIEKGGKIEIHHPVNYVGSPIFNKATTFSFYRFTEKAEPIIVFLESDRALSLDLDIYFEPLPLR